MKKYLLVVSFLIVSNSYSFESFKNENKKLTATISCKNSKITPASGSWGALYGCIGGSEETVKLFVNEKPGTGKVKNVKFLWNDWTKDTGSGVHSDSKISNLWLKNIANLYAPKKKQEVIKMFHGNKDKVVEAKNYTLKYTYYVGPAIDERMLIITSK